MVLLISVLILFRGAKMNVVTYYDENNEKQLKLVNLEDDLIEMVEMNPEDYEYMIKV